MLEIRRCHFGNYSLIFLRTYSGYFTKYWILDRFTMQSRPISLK
ncbi:unnamed protein product [Callosobruchus maculatus]|uniref:Uncharacterized protein n=1 Tax=Callosobruchus maculatus TaxID=64391 RepID=A0A653CZU4_CALMS|nr:unnamed protein product [Callosobruchus maculatus]